MVTFVRTVRTVRTRPLKSLGSHPAPVHGGRASPIICNPTLDGVASRPGPDDADSAVWAPLPLIFPAFPTLLCPDYPDRVLTRVHEAPAGSYGERVDVQGWFDSIVSTMNADYGGTYANLWLPTTSDHPSGDPRQGDTSTFVGTSGAAPQVAAAAAVVGSDEIS